MVRVLVAGVPGVSAVSSGQEGVWGRFVSRIVDGTLHVYGFLSISSNRLRSLKAVIISPFVVVSCHAGKIHGCQPLSL